ncbi:Zinc finger C2H2-type [Trinorchestia longiramus]|nr:Zinc finger C2H2-type [Trinorchestia longiramus]
MDLPESTVLCLDENGKLLSSKKAVYVKMPCTSADSKRNGTVFDSEFITDIEQCWYISEGAVEHTEFIPDDCSNSATNSIVLPAALHSEDESQSENDHLIFLSPEQLRKDEVYVITEGGDSVTLEMLRTTGDAAVITEESYVASDDSSARPRQEWKKRNIPSPSSNTKKSSVYRSFKCQVCNKAFSSNYSLSCHMRTHTKETPYHCPVDGCYKKFKMSGDLAKHIRSHTGERPFVCEICGRGFTTCNILKVHTRTHTGERPYVCTDPNCGKRFSSDTNLKNHVRIHSGEKPYVCPVPECSKRFTEYSSLFKHKVVHENFKKFICHLCFRQYRQSCTLRHHLRTAHEVESCNSCGSCSQCVGKKKTSAVAQSSAPAAIAPCSNALPDPPGFLLEALQCWPDVSEEDSSVGVQLLVPTSKTHADEETPILLLASDALLTDQQFVGGDFQTNGVEGSL